MKARIVFLLLAACAGGAQAQYKCTGADGKISFQQQPCIGARSEEKLDVVPNGHPRAASGAASGPAAARRPVTPPAPAPAAAPAAPNVDKKMLQRYEAMRRRDALADALKAAQDEQAARANDRLQDIAGAKRQFGDEPANAAALRDALASIDRRYAALSELDQSRINRAQAELDAWDRSNK
jgi:Domain of unknown function (DUF4124)